MKTRAIQADWIATKLTVERNGEKELTMETRSLRRPDHNGRIGLQAHLVELSLPEIH
jgi:hypothetical protein